MHGRHFTPFPELASNRLLLRRLNSKDVAGIFALRSNAVVNKYLDRPIAKSFDDAAEFIKKINLAIDSDQSIFWVIAYKDQPDLVGTICLWNFSDVGNKAEIGYELLPQYHGQGIMQEAILTIVRYGFETLKLQKIEAWTVDQNVYSIGVLERNHFRRDLDAEDRPDRKKEGNETVVYSLFNERASTSQQFLAG